MHCHVVNNILCRIAEKQQFLSDKMTGFKNGHFLVVVLTASIKRLGSEKRDTGICFDIS